MIRPIVLSAAVVLLVAGIVVNAKPSMASSPVIYGTNMGLYDANEQMFQPSTQAILEGWQTPVIRVPSRSSLSDATELQALQTVKTIGATPLFIVHGAVDSNVMADDQHLLALAAQVFGSSTVYVEYGNEEDASVSASAYTASWNAVVPTLKAQHPTYQFIGPVTAYAYTSYIATFVQNANPAPDVVSWHEYACGPGGSTSSCFGAIANWSSHVASINAAERTAAGRTFPFMITEWNMDYADDPRYSDPTVIGPWTTQALQELNSLVASGLIGAQQYVAATHSSDFQLINPDNSLTPQGQAFSASRLGTPAPAPSPLPSPSPGPSPSPSPNCGGGTGITLSGSQSASVLNDVYHLQANEWASSAPFSVTSNSCAQFQIASSSISNSTSGPPGAYPSLYRGCHWGNCTSNSGLPLTVSSVETPGTLTTSFDTSVITGGAWDDSYDIWWNAASATSNNSSNGLEMMIWLSHLGPVQPAGSVVASNVNIGGQSYNVWHAGSSPGGTVSFVLTTPANSVTNLDLGPLATDAVARGYMLNSWYLIDVEAGFEPWIGGQGLQVNSFSVCDSAGCQSASPTPMPAPSPRPSPSPTPSPSPSPTPGPAAAGSTHYDFEDGTLQGWGKRWGTITVANSSAEAYDGTHSLAITSTGGYQAVGARTPGLSSGMSITYRIWTPQPVAVAPFATDNAWHNYFWPTTFLSAGWNTVSWKVPSMAVVTGIGLQVNLFNGTVYLDEASW